MPASAYDCDVIAKFQTENMADDVVAPLATATAAVTEAAKQFNLTEGKCYGGEELGIDVLGLVAIIVFYLAVLGVRKFKSTAQLSSHICCCIGT